MVYEAPHPKSQPESEPAMRHVYLICCVIGLWSGMSQPKAQAKSKIKRIALLVWHDQGWKGTQPDQPLRYPKRDAQLVEQVLRTKGHFRTIVLARPTAKKLRYTLAQFERNWSTEDKVHFLFYYSGHADTKYLRLGPQSQHPQQRFSLQELANRLKKLKARIKLGILDACNSGALIDLLHARSKGRGQGYAAFFQIPSSLSQGMAILTSASTFGKARELDRLRASLFTYYLTQGLWGRADQDLDGKVTSIEAYNYARVKMERHLPGQQQPMYLNHFRGQGAYAITASYNASMVLPMKRGEQYTLISAKATWNIKAKDDQARLVSVMAGQYDVYLRRKEGDAEVCFVQKVQVKSKRLLLSRKRWRSTKCPTAVSKGPDASKAFDIADELRLGPTRRVSAAFVAGPLTASLYRPLWGGSVSLTWERWRFLLTFLGEQRTDSFAALTEAAVGWGWDFQWDRFHLHTGFLFGLGLLTVQHSTKELTGYSPSLRYGLHLEAAIRLHTRWWLLARGFFGPTHTVVRASVSGGEFVNGLAGQGSLALSVRF